MIRQPTKHRAEGGDYRESASRRLMFCLDNPAFTALLGSFTDTGIALALTSSRRG